MGRTKDIFLKEREHQILNNIDCFMDEQYHYERDGRTLEDMERETKEEEDNINLNKG